jgi:hypothetical protein
MKFLSVLLFCCFTFSLFSQKINTGDKTQDANAPQESYQTIEKPRFLSTINIPFDVAMADVEKQINANLPLMPAMIYEDNSMEDNNGDNFMCKVWKRANISVVAQQDNLFNLNVPLKIWVKMGYKTLGLTIPPQETTFELVMKFQTRFSIDPTWQALTQTQLTGYEWITKPSLNFAGMNIPITPFVEKALNNNQSKFTKGIDEGVRKNVEIKKYVLQAWNTTLQPSLLSEKYRTWLKVTPVELQMTPFKTQNNRLVATIGLKAYTETLTGDKPIVTPASQIPNLSLVPQIADNFQVGVSSEIPFAEAARLSADTMVGQIFSFKDGKYKVEVTEIDVYGKDDQLVIKAGLTGNMKGNIYFKGVPTFNPSDTTVFLDKFDYDLQTKNILLKVGNWLFAGKLAKQMKEALTFKIAGQLRETRQQIQATLTRNQVAKGVLLQGKLDDFVFDKVFLTPRGISITTFVKGRVGLLVDGL